MFRVLKKDFICCHRRLMPFSIILLYRLGNYLEYSRMIMPVRKLLIIIIKIIQKVYSDIIFKVEIPFKAKIGDGLRISHPQGIIISEFAILGNNCTIFHQVTIGMNEHNKIDNYGVPKVGNNVYIGCGAKIIGGITVGDNVKIGANAVVTRDIPSNSTVIGNNIVRRLNE